MPKAAIHGHTSKIKRFYWREIQFRVYDLLAELGVTSDAPLSEVHGVTIEEIEARALADIKALHEISPKFSFETESEAAFLARVPVEVVELHAAVRIGGKVVRDDDTTCSPEDFAAEWLANLGYDTIRCESVPIHTLFAVLLWTLIQDPADPRVRVVMFGDRVSSEQNGRSVEQVWTSLPEDFGGKGYSARRASEIDEFFAKFLEGGREDLLSVFDLCVDGSYGLRQYLWAHRDEDLARARRLLSVVPPEYIRRALRYLLDDYWRHYLGWPDLFAWGPDDFLFVEVKLSGDKLSDEQRTWIERNSDTLRLPFKLLKIHKLAK